MFGVLRSEKDKLLQQFRKRVVNSFMDILILAELRNAPMSGYDVISLIYRRFHFLPSAGSVYSLLYALERRELVKGMWNERKRLYILAPKGEEIIEATLNLQGKIEDFMAKILTGHPL